MNRKNTILSKYLRKRSTLEEKKLWFLLQDRRMWGFKFRRQVWIDKYCVDFCCYKARLLIELDGNPHNCHVVKQNDLERTKYLKGQGFKVLRFWNSDIVKNEKIVLEKILKVLSSPSSALRASSPARGEDKRKKY